MHLSVASGQLYRLCWALRNRTEERIDLDAEEQRQEEAAADVDEGKYPAHVCFEKYTFSLNRLFISLVCSHGVICRIFSISRNSLILKILNPA